ncbi:MAG: glycosyltransferase [Agriterribacter sp.]
MRVIISQNERFLPKDKWFSDFAHNMALNLCKQYPQYGFFLLSYDSKSTLPLPENASQINVTYPFIINWICKKWWYEKKIKATIQQVNADAIISFSHNKANTIIPEYRVILNAAIPQAAALSNNVRLLTTSMSVKKELMSRQVSEEKIKVIRPYIEDVYAPADFDTAEEVKKKHAAGKEYFLLDASDTSNAVIINVLKAFSVFKKWQRSDTQLLLININTNVELNKLLETYKHKQDVQILTDSISRNSEIISAAFAFIYLPVKDDFGLNLMQAMHCDVPVLTCEADVLKEIGNDAVLYVDAADVKDISEKLIKVFKDEKLRNQLIQKSRIQLKELAAEDIL